MANVLAHLGAQTLISRSLVPRADYHWIFIGCIAPDIPWIMQRIVRSLIPWINLYDLRLYVIAQSSLLISLVLCAALALLSAAPRRVFGLLALNSLLHLLLDSLQTKLANGVHLFAPFSWELLNFGLFWPENPVTYALTACGLLIFAHAWRQSDGWSFRPFAVGRTQLFLALGLLTLYGTAPLLFLYGPEIADNHFVRTLRDDGARPGRAVEFDRVRYFQRDGHYFLRTFAGEELRFEPSATGSAGTLSVRGFFVDSDTVHVHHLHNHHGRVRDLASYVGLLLVGLFWLRVNRVDSEARFAYEDPQADK